MRRAGFEDVSCWLEPREVTPADPRSFVQTVCLVRHLDPLPEELREPFIDRVLELDGHPFVLHYVRREHHRAAQVGAEPGRRPPSESDLRAHHHRPVAGQPEVPIGLAALRAIIMNRCSCASGSSRASVGVIVIRETK